MRLTRRQMLAASTSLLPIGCKMDPPSPDEELRQAFEDYRSGRLVGG